MNAFEFHIGVNLTVQKIASNINDDFLPQEIDYFLNEAIEDFIKEQYSLIKNEERDIQSQYVNENIRTLITTAEVDTLSVVDYMPNTVKGSLPSDYKYYISARTLSDESWKNNRILSPKGIKPYIETEFNSPRFREFPIIIEGEELMVIGDASNKVDVTSKIRLTYIKSPSKIDITDDPQVEYASLPSHTHSTIVNIASQKILTIISPQE